MTVRVNNSNLGGHALSMRYRFYRNMGKFLPLAEFAYNNSYQATIGMAPYEALYGRKCRSPVHWDEAGERSFLEPELVEQATEAIKKIRENEDCLEQTKELCRPPSMPSRI